jgi:hypothetical protein
MQQHREAQLERRVRREHLEHDHGVGEHIALRMPLRRLVAADGRQHFGQEVADQIGFHQMFHSGPRRGEVRILENSSRMRSGEIRSNNGRNRAARHRWRARW